MDRLKYRKMIAGFTASALMVILVSGCASSTDGFGDKFEFPVAYGTPMVLDSESDILIQLNEDGSAELSGFPMGVMKDSEGRICADPMDPGIGGKAEWKFASDTTILVTSGNRSMEIAASPGKFDSVDWIDPLIRECNGDSRQLALRSDLRTPND